MNRIPLPERPYEIAVNLNPAHTALTIGHSVTAFAESSDNPQHAGMPLMLAFLILPLVFHEDSRETMPRTRSTRMQMWLSAHGEVLQGFAERTRWLSPYTREALIFGAHMNTLVFLPEGSIHPVAGSIQDPPSGDPVQPIIAAAKLVGRWFAQIPESSAIFQMLGVRP